MPINIEDVMDKLQNSDDSVSNALILRLYSEYEKNEGTKIEEEITVAKIINAHNRIIKAMKKELDNNEQDHRLFVYFIMLNNNLSNFSIKDKKNIEKSLDLITMMEAMLKLDITFTSRIENCLDKLLEEKKVIKKTR